MNGLRPRLSTATLLGWAMALFLLSGRWNLQRVVAIDGSVLTAPRMWLVTGVLLVSLVPLRSRRDVLPPAGLVTFVGYFLLTTLWAPSAQLASDKAVDLLVMTLGILGLRRLIVHVGVRATTASLWRVFAVTFGAFAVIGLASSVLGSGGRLSVLGGGPNVYGRNMGVLLVVCLAAMLREGRSRGWPLAGVVVAGLLVVLTGSRGALGGTMVGVATLLFLRRVQVGRTALALGFSALGLAAFARWTEVGRAAIESFEHRVIVLTLQQGYDSGRGPLREAAFDLIARKPWLGDGLNGFRARGYGVYPHNLELEALTDGGMVGLFVLLLALAVPLLALAMRSRHVDPVTGAVFMLHLACAQVSGDFYDSRGVFLFGMLLALQFTARPGAVRSRPPKPMPGGPYRR